MQAYRTRTPNKLSVDTQHHLGAFPLPCFQSLEGGLCIVEAIAAIDERAQLSPVLPHELRGSRIVVDTVTDAHQVLPPQGKLRGVKIGLRRRETNQYRRTPFLSRDGVACSAAAEPEHSHTASQSPAGSASTVL